MFLEFHIIFLYIYIQYIVYRPLLYLLLYYIVPPFSIFTDVKKYHAQILDVRNETKCATAHCVLRPKDEGDGDRESRGQKLFLVATPEVFLFCHLIVIQSRLSSETNCSAFS